MAEERPFEGLADEVKRLSERLQTLVEGFAAELPMFLGTAREALLLARCALAAVQRQLDAAEFLHLTRRLKGQPMDPVSQWAYEKTLEIAGGEDQANAFTVWLIASAEDLPKLCEEGGSALDNQAAYEAWLRDRHVAYIAAEGKIP